MQKLASENIKLRSEMKVLRDEHTEVMHALHSQEKAHQRMSEALSTQQATSRATPDLGAAHQRSSRAPQGSIESPKCTSPFTKLLQPNKDARQSLSPTGTIRTDLHSLGAEYANGMYTFEPGQKQKINLKPAISHSSSQDSTVLTAGMIARRHQERVRSGTRAGTQSPTSDQENDVHH